MVVSVQSVLLVVTHHVPIDTKATKIFNRNKQQLIKLTEENTIDD